MKIKSVTQGNAYCVKTDEDGWNEYTRYSANNWTVRMGESDESIYETQELEAAFQAQWLASNGEGLETHKCRLCGNVSEWHFGCIHGGMLIHSAHKDQ